LSAAIRVTKEEIHYLQICAKKLSEETFLKLFTLKSIIKFFSQFIEDLIFDEEFDEIFHKILEKPDKLIKIIMKLPDILRKKNILSEDRCKGLHD